MDQESLTNTFFVWDIPETYFAGKPKRISTSPHIPLSESGVPFEKSKTCQNVFFKKMLPWLHVSSMPPPGGDCPPSSSIAALMLFLQRGIRCCFCSSSRPARQRQPCSSSALRTAALVPALARVECSGAQPEWAQVPHKSTDVKVLRCFCSKVARERQPCSANALS